MFFFRKLFGLFFIAFLVFGFLGFFGRGGHGRYQSAYQQGFTAGAQAAAGSEKAVPEGAEETSTAAPERVPGANVYYRGHGFFFPGFGFFLCLMPFFLLGLLFMGFGKRRWHRHGHHRGQWGRYKGGHGPCGRGPWAYGPWGDGEDRADRAGTPQEKSPDDIDDGPDEPIMRA